MDCRISKRIDVCSIALTGHSTDLTPTVIEKRTE